ncbi:ATP synthase subunit O, mitochondrial-like [Juglans microcarpa x Juglans regia]|uniref:ATP synthase subunit O, mitochondrial-like n=1 Tax=Juglans microcarpa x Juglans regia TaxID=2249226 RepID=UPI001B7DFFCB|nr:ATP synthase subunit O, mitochondrial-like [Juglans microcarpa x Juglans regia]
MTSAIRIRSGLPLLSKLLRSGSLSSQRPELFLSTSEFSRNYATAAGQKEDKVKVPLALFGGSGNYASALYLAAVKQNALDKVEAELRDLVEALKKSPTFSGFTKDLSVPADIRVKAIQEISNQAKFSEVTKSFFVLLADNGRLRFIDSISKRFVELTMAHRGEMKAVVTTVIPLPPEEEKLERTEGNTYLVCFYNSSQLISSNHYNFFKFQLLTLISTYLISSVKTNEVKDIIGRGKKVNLEQKIDSSILVGLVVEFGQKVFDMSIKTRVRQMERFLREPVNFGSL